MKYLIQQHKFYLIPYVIILIAGIVIVSQIEKGDVLFYFADNRTTFLNTFFIFATKLGEIAGYLLFIVIFLFIRFRYSILIAFTAASAGIVAAILKNLFRHPRPKPYFGKLGIDISDIAVAGQPLLNSQISSFPSGHTISAFAFFTVLALLTKNNFVKLTCLLLAIFVGLSRIYLVHHFLEDVLLGSFIGVLIGFLLHYINNKIPITDNKWYNRKIKLSISP
ncbi:MAG: phosphatase PAP2 family protein [Saprospiraceae bacterium]